MERKSGKLIINDEGKLILTGEVFDGHGSYDFNAYVDTGSIFGIVLTQELADAVCAKVEGEVDISIGAGSGQTKGQIRKANLRFGELVIENYQITVVKGNRNLIGIKFFQDVGAGMIVDFHKGKTMGGLITNERKLVKAIGKTAHCFLEHKNDIVKSYEPCPICGQQGE